MSTVEERTSHPSRFSPRSDDRVHTQDKQHQPARPAGWQNLEVAQVQLDVGAFVRTRCRRTTSGNRRTRFFHGGRRTSGNRCSPSLPRRSTPTPRAPRCDLMCSEARSARGSESATPRSPSVWLGPPPARVGLGERSRRRGRGVRHSRLSLRRRAHRRGRHGRLRYRLYGSFSVPLNHRNASPVTWTASRLVHRRFFGVGKEVPLRCRARTSRPLRLRSQEREAAGAHFEPLHPRRGP